MNALRLFPLLVVMLLADAAFGQQTVFDVPSADVLGRGKVYAELDGTLRPSDSSTTFTPRIVVGVGHHIEAGLNFNGLATPSAGELILSPTIKWKAWNSGDSGWSFFAGDDLFFPVHDRSYTAGNYVYGEFAKTWKRGTRVGFGGYDFTRDVVAPANRAGGQFTVEQPAGKRLTLAAEWYTGNHASGYVNPGAIVKLTKDLTLYAAYQIGNAGVTHGNHQFLWEIGYNFN